MGSSDDATRVAVEVVVTGHVQGVWFRGSTRDEARRQGVTGWVRNEPDGTVRAHLEGERADVDAVIDWMRRGGPRMAQVDLVSTRPAEVGAHHDFRVA